MGKKEEHLGLRYSSIVEFLRKMRKEGPGFHSQQFPVRLCPENSVQKNQRRKGKKSIGPAGPPPRPQRACANYRKNRNGHLEHLLPLGTWASYWGSWTQEASGAVLAHSKLLAVDFGGSASCKHIWWAVAGTGLPVVCWLHRETRAFLNCPLPWLSGSPTAITMSVSAEWKMKTGWHVPTGLVSLNCADGLLFPHNENTWVFVWRASGKRPSSCICPLIYTLQNKADLQESKESRSSGWAACSLPPTLASFSFRETIVGVPTSPKLPPLEKKGKKLFPGWLKLKHLCARNPQMSDRLSSAADPSARHTVLALGWFGLVTN